MDIKVILVNVIQLDTYNLIFIYGLVAKKDVTLINISILVVNNVKCCHYFAKNLTMDFSDVVVV